MSRSSIKSETTKREVHVSTPGWKAKFINERTVTVIFGMFCILSVVFALWALYRSGVSLKRVESMNHTLADLMVKRHEEVQKQSTPIISMVQDAGIPPDVEQSIKDLKRKTEEISKIQIDRKTGFDNMIRARQNEISKLSDLGEMQAQLRNAVSDIKQETSTTKLEMSALRQEMNAHSFIPETFSHMPDSPSLTPDISQFIPSHSAFIPSVSRQKEVIDEEVFDQEELLRDLQYLEEDK